MERTAGDTRALGEGIVFLDYFKDLPDPRQSKVLYPLDEVLLLCLLAALARSEAITDIVRFGEKKLELLRQFRRFLRRNAFPRPTSATSDDARRRAVSAMLRGVGGDADRMLSDVVAIDCKTSSRSNKGAQEAIRMVSAFAARIAEPN